MIHVVAIITAKPGQRAAILDNFAANRPAVSISDAGVKAQQLRRMTTLLHRPASIPAAPST